MSIEIARDTRAATAPAATRALRRKLASALGREPGNPRLQNLHGVLQLQNGDLDSAIRAFRLAAESEPDNASFQINLGAALLKAGRPHEAIAPLEAALARTPDDPEGRLAAAQAHLSTRSFNEAVAHADALVARQPDHRGARYIKAVVHLERQQHDAAVRLLDGLVADDLENVDVWVTLAVALLGKGAMLDAARCLKAALLLRPRDLTIALHFARALAPLNESAQAAEQVCAALLADRDRHAACTRLLSFAFERPEFACIARRAFELALSETGPDAILLERFAALLRHEGLEAEALDCIEIAIAQDPCAVTPHIALGALLEAAGADHRAIDAFRRATQIDPANAEAQYRLGTHLNRAGNVAEAQAAFEASVAADPRHLQAYASLGALHTEAGRHEDSLDFYVRAKALDPTQENIRLQVLYSKRNLFDWSDRIVPFSEVASLGLGTGVMPFGLLFLEDAPERQLVRARNWAAQWGTGVAAPAIRRDGSDDRIHIGYFSADFYDFAGMHLMIGMLERHDRDRFIISAFSYARGPEDSMYRRILGAVDHFYDVSGLSSDRIAAESRNAGLDIALHRNGYTRRHRTEIFAHRAAPVQINYLGYPGTLGAPFIDYIIGDRTVIDATNRHCISENVIFMPATYQPNDNTRATPERAGSRSDHGLPEHGIVLCCFNNGFKIGPDEFDVWCRILKRHPGSCLWILSDGGSGEDRLRREATARGVAPDRLVFAPRTNQAAHLARQAHADIFVDTFAYNAHTTASDALLAGLPVVTLLGRQFSARVCASLCRAAGHPELVTGSVAEYETRIEALIADPAERRAIRESLLRCCRDSPLFDTQAYTTAIERGFVIAAERARKGLPPVDIDL